MDIHKYIQKQKEIYEYFFDFIYDDGESNETYFNLINSINIQNIFSNQEDIRLFLRLISIISENHYRHRNFFKKIEQLLSYILLDKAIKQNLTNDEIFDIFKGNKLIILFLLKKEIISFNQYVINSIYMMNNSNGTLYRHFFYPELKHYIQPSKVKKIETELSQFGQNCLNDFDVKRLNGENDSYISTLIRQDLVKDFIIHVNKTNLSLLSEIEPSIFETNPFLLKKNPTLIEYAAFYGSIQIFQYLKMNNVSIEPSIFLYAIHSNKSELIYLLEREKIEANYEKCLEESIKCHHNDIASYIRDNFKQEKETINQNNFNHNIFKYTFQHHNWKYIPENDDDYLNGFIFCYLCKYNYVDLVDLLLKQNKVNYNFKFKSSKFKKLTISPLYLASLNRNIKIVELLRNQPKIDFISYGFYNNKKLVQISIPSYLTKINEKTFYGCSFLTQIKIPNSINSIENGAFEKCISLKQISIPSSVIKIGNNSFKDCVSLLSIEIPSSVNSIGEKAFENCSLIKEITIPEKVTEISYGIFKNCTSLKSIKILSKLESVGAYAFSECSSLIEFPYESKQKMISSYAFNKCTSLMNVVVPLQVNSIGSHAFYECKSLKSIDIPDSVEIIKECAFSYCSLLEQFKFPSNLKVIEPMSFYHCSSLKEMNLSNIIRIGRNSFAYCSNLRKVELPTTLLTIRSHSFHECALLKEIKIPSSACVDDDAFDECTVQKH